VRSRLKPGGFKLKLLRGPQIAQMRTYKATCGQYYDADTTLAAPKPY